MSYQEKLAKELIDHCNPILDDETYLSCLVKQGGKYNQEIFD
jgi:hypothetical protein